MLKILKNLWKQRFPYAHKCTMSQALPFKIADLKACCEEAWFRSIIVLCGGKWWKNSKKIISQPGISRKHWRLAFPWRKLDWSVTHHHIWPLNILISLVRALIKRYGKRLQHPCPKSFHNCWNFIIASITTFRSSIKAYKIDKAHPFGQPRQEHLHFDEDVQPEWSSAEQRLARSYRWAGTQAGLSCYWLILAMKSFKNINQDEIKVLFLCWLNF